MFQKVYKDEDQGGKTIAKHRIHNSNHLFRFRCKEYLDKEGAFPSIKLSVGLAILQIVKDDQNNQSYRHECETRYCPVVDALPVFFLAALVVLLGFWITETVCRGITIILIPILFSTLLR